MINENQTLQQALDQMDKCYQQAASLVLIRAYKPAIAQLQNALKVYFYVISDPQTKL